MDAYFKSKNYKYLFFTLFIFTVTPILFSKINLIGNHEIPNYLINFDNLYSYIIGHDEINFLIETENQRYRPSFYIIKGLEYFIFKDSHFLTFFYKFILSLFIAFMIFKINEKLFEKRKTIFLSSASIILFPTNYDIFSRLDVQEFYFLIFFFPLFFLILKNNTEFDRGRNLSNDVYILLLSIIIIGIKENLVFHFLIFILSIFIFNLKLNFFKNKIYYFYFFFIICLYFYKFFLVYNNVGASAYDLEFNHNKLIILLKNFPLQNILNPMLLLSWTLIIYLNFKKKIKLIHFKFFIILSFHIIFDYLFYQGIGSYRHYIIGLICLIYILAILYDNYIFRWKLISDSKIYLNFSLFSLILFLSIIQFSLNLKMTIQNNKEHKILKTIYSSQESLILNNEHIDEKVIAIAYFSKFYKPHKNVFFLYDNKLVEFTDINLKFKFKYPSSILDIDKKKYECLVFSDNSNLYMCNSIVYFPKEIDLF